MRGFRVQDLSIQPGCLGGATDVHVAREGVHSRANGGEEMIDGSTPTVQVCEPAAPLQELDFSFEDIHGMRNLSLEGVASTRAYERVGILSLGKRDDADRRTLAQQFVSRPECRLEASLVTVVKK